MEIKEMVDKLCEALDNKKANDVVAIDITGLSDLADYFVIASANNMPHLDALADETGRFFAQQGIDAKSVEGENGSSWILFDYRDIIVHLMTEEDRSFYDIEKVWRDGKIITMKDIKKD